MKNADQLIAQDVEKFCQVVSELYSNLTKPVLDVVVYNWQLAKNLGINGVIALTVCIIFFFKKKFFFKIEKKTDDCTSLWHVYSCYYSTLW
jgi:ABC-type uncharacterized transport system fused permease/ATPase subunit